MNNKEKINEILKKSDAMLSLKEIAKKCSEDQECMIGGNTPEKTIGSIFYTDDEDLYKKNAERPIKWGLKNKTYINENATSSDNIDDNESYVDEKSKKYDERDLHKFLVGYMRSKDGENNAIYCKTVYHEDSRKEKKGQAVWLHPDIVGVKFLLDTYKVEDTKKLKKSICDNPFEFYSFEMKQKIDTGNLSENYFQAVANSSWANYGYLVAYEIDITEPSLMEKMRRLSNKFGIGIIKLNIEHYAQSDVICEAKYNEEIDYDTIDTLIAISPDYKQFIEKCNEYITLEDKKYKKILIDETFDYYYKDEDEAYKNLNKK